ncbi:sensor histidine kinase [Methanolacinia petrolearia]|uniref:sensor histidine kinase n=1 Tax=Methanolacinia petrolearia TaxID=54120 RepID=UPI003BAA544F
MTAEQYAERFIPTEERFVVPEEAGKAIESTDRNYVAQVEHRIIRRDGEIRYINVSIRAIKDENGRTVKLWGVNQDITERKMAEEALSVINNKLNMLSSITRHDILNTIMAVRGYIELSEDFIENPEMRKYIEKEKEAVNAIQHQIEFTQQYQDIGVNEPGWQDTGNMADFVAKTLDLDGIKFKNALHGLEIFCVPLTEKVFYNLIENSLRHGENVNTIGFSYSEKGGSLVIYYRDNGVGITDGDRDKLFRKGFGKHTGLGLFLSREILSITGISITENGKEGEGVNFEIVVPKGGYRFASVA